MTTLGETAAQDHIEADLNMIPPPVEECTARADLLTRFALKYAVNPETGCWEWTDGVTKAGYGNLRTAAGRPYAHRVAYELFVGPIPPGLQIDHLCRVRRCVNPFHLEPVTRRENLLRGTSPWAVNKRKTECRNGHPYTDENTYTRPNGNRECRACWRARKAPTHPGDLSALATTTVTGCWVPADQAGENPHHHWATRDELEGHLAAITAEGWEGSPKIVRLHGTCRVAVCATCGGHLTHWEGAQVHHPTATAAIAAAVTEGRTNPEEWHQGDAWSVRPDGRLDCPACVGENP